MSTSNSVKQIPASIVEGLFVRALGTRLTPTAHERLRQAGLALDQKLEPTYPLEKWKDFLRVAADHVYAGMPLEAAYYAMGERLMDAWSETLTGRALLGVMKLAGPMRTLNRAGRTFLSHDAASEVRLTEKGPSSAELRVGDVLADMPTFAAGVLSRSLELVGAHNVVALPEAFDGTACTFHVRWSEEPVGYITEVLADSTVDAAAAESREQA
ncbi:DUF2378 family protein [Aggregicoccus sp. 17bor-14]|uniref:DUF2378 family protein n=1 Tax=Myxococcaceae TaxID=31 RepID=UPI00129CA68C|nr:MULTISPECIES: DUF2378 family protein [Myxococcaceae]MBF5045595.1 DUF2378 family protein [Simulacricoccus sp. 17bor-14]MRI91332.1 DUF2378 family protein [Aggregicoccus sp. 17bor-14]